MNGQIAFVVGDSFVAKSGLTYVAKNLYRILTEMGYQVMYLSASGQQHEEASNCVYIGNSLKKFDEQVEKYKPELVLTVHDPWMIVYTVTSSYRHTFNLILYQPVEADYYPEQVIFNPPDEQKVRPISIAEVVKDADTIIAYNSFGAKGVKAMGAEVDACIHNGLDDIRVRIVENAELIKNRRALIGVKDDEVLFMHMGRNSTRKRQDIMLEAWHRFLKLGFEQLGERPKAKLYMHTDRYSFNGLDIPSILNRLKITDTVVMPTNIDFSNDDLNIFYNACDVYIGLPSGEGHGLGFAEAMAVKKPLIYGSYGGHTTFCKGAGIEVPPLAFISAQNIDAPRAIINPKKAAEAMLTLYLDKELRKKYGEIGFEKSKELHWKVLDPQFKEVINKSMANNKKANSIFAKKVV